MRRIIAVAVVLAASVCVLPGCRWRLKANTDTSSASLHNILGDAKYRTMGLNARIVIASRRGGAINMRLFGLRGRAVGNHIAAQRAYGLRSNGFRNEVKQQLANRNSSGSGSADDSCETYRDPSGG